MMQARPSRGRAGAAGLLACLGFGAVLSLLGGCTNGDFGRVRQELVLDNVHDWVGTTAAQSGPGWFSQYPLSDDERMLRDLAYPLIEPPYERQRWYSVLNEYGISRIWHHDWSKFDELAYTRALASRPFRSEAARYARLNDDIRNDSVRVQPFFQVAARVLNMDRKREKSLAFVEGVTPREQMNALARIDENALVISWVQWSLTARTLSYRLALERLAIAVPTPAVSEAERSLVNLQDVISRYRILPGPDIAPGPGVVTIPPFAGPVLPQRPPRRPRPAVAEAPKSDAPVASELGLSAPDTVSAVGTAF